MRFRSLSLLAISVSLLLACDKPEAQKDPATVTSAAPAPAPSAPTSAAASASASAEPATSAAPSASAASSAAPTTTTTAAASASGKVVTTTTTTTGPLNCGTKPLPDCPLQAWMKHNTAIALSSNDMTALAGDFEKVGKMAPPGYTNWASISKDGAAAAKAGTVDAAKAACRGCHDQYKAKYKTEMRARPLP